MKKIGYLIVPLLLFIFGCNSTTNVGDIEEIIEKNEIIETVNKLFIETDNRNWERVKESFTDSVYFDMTSLAGGDPVVISSKDIVDSWDAGLKSLKALHHQVGNYIVNINDSNAEIFCYGIASHYLPNNSGKNVRTFVGSYNFGMRKIDSQWKIEKFKFNLKYIDGNLELEKG